MKSNILLGFLLTTILLMHLQFVVAAVAVNDTNDTDPSTNSTGSNNGSNQSTGTTGQNNPTISVPVPIGAVIASIAGMLLIAYRKIE